MTTQRKLTCPIRGCQRAKRSGIHVMCSQHWFMVPLVIRNKVWALYRSEPGSDSHRMAIEAAIHEVEVQETPA